MELYVPCSESLQCWSCPLEEQFRPIPSVVSSNFETAAVACEEQELVVAAQACWVSSAASSVGNLVEDPICVVLVGT